MEEVQSQSLYKRILQKLNNIPEVLKPTKFIGYVIGAGFIISLGLGLLNLNLGQMMNGEVASSAMNIGWPWTMFSLSLTNPETFPLIIPGLIFDLLLYVIAGYILNIPSNYAVSKVKSMFPDKKPEEETQK
jgi:hypothetical protein